MQLPSSVSLNGLLVQLFALSVETLRGPSKLSEIVPVGHGIECLMAYSVQGYTINIHCQEKKYLCKYRYWYVKDTVKTIYHVRTELSPDAPKTLKEFCAEDRYFPKLLGFLMPSASQKEAAIGAYLDLIIAKFQQA